MMILETPRLRLRQMDHADATHLLGIFADPEVMSYYRSTKDRSETEAWIDRNMQSYETHGFGLWIVESRETGAFLGQCGITMQEVEGVREPEIGYLFLRSAWGHGFATEAAAACRDYGFALGRYERMICLPAAANTPSRRVAERIGFGLERIIEQRGKEVCLYTLKSPLSRAAGPVSRAG